MPMSLANRAGIFLPDEIDAMRVEFDAGRVPNETAAQREDRATVIIARYQAKRGEAKPPQL